MTTKSPFENIDALHWAAMNGDLQSVKDLVAKGEPINAFDDLAYTPLHWAAVRGHIEIVEFLVDVGADVNAHDESRVGNTVLHEVAKDCSFQLAKLLIDAGADTSIPGWVNKTAFYVLCLRTDEDGIAICKMLKKA